MKSVFLFWILGAIDGHAKNFSLKIGSQGRYTLCPLYDVMSAYPMTAKRQIEWQELKMAMSLRGKKRHYLWSTIQLRHWFAMANKCQFSQIIMQEIIEEALDNMENVINHVMQIIPSHFPEKIFDSIFLGMRKVKNRCVKSLNK